MINRCGNIAYVPFVEHPKGASYIPEFHPDTFVSLEVPDEGSIYYKEFLESQKLAEKQEMAERERRSRVDAGAHGATAKTAGDIDLSKEIDDSPSVPKHVLEETSRRSFPRNNLFHGGDGVAHRGDLKPFEDHLNEPPGQRNIELYMNIAFDLSCFFMVFVMIYCICVPSRSLKKQ